MEPDAVSLRTRSVEYILICHSKHAPFVIISDSFPPVLQKGLPESEVSVMSPVELGGFQSDEYLAINPQGKVPALKCQIAGITIAESDTVCRYLMSTYADTGPSFQPDNPASNMIARFHDIYLTSIQMCLYKPGPPFGMYGTRKDALREFSKQMYVIGDLMDETGPYLCGNEVSLADAAVFPTIAFAVHMLPKFDHSIDKPVPEHIEKWFQTMIDTDDAFKQVYDEVRLN
jgi:glutathione S-transferase